MEQRESITLIKIHGSRKTWFKLSAASAVAWSPKQLLDCHFHFSRNKGYWHALVKESVLLAAIKSKLGVEVRIQEIGDRGDGGAGGDGEDVDPEARKPRASSGDQAKTARASRAAARAAARVAKANKLVPVPAPTTVKKKRRGGGIPASPAGGVIRRIGQATKISRKVGAR
jgi:hypothetical protein